VFTLLVLFGRGAAAGTLFPFAGATSMTTLLGAPFGAILILTFLTALFLTLFLGLLFFRVFPGVNAETTELMALDIASIYSSLDSPRLKLLCP
jgi:hypothetical protein